MIYHNEMDLIEWMRRTVRNAVGTNLNNASKRLNRARIVAGSLFRSGEMKRMKWIWRDGGGGVDNFINGRGNGREERSSG